MWKKKTRFFFCNAYISASMYISLVILPTCCTILYVNFTKLRANPTKTRGVRNKTREKLVYRLWHENLDFSKKSWFFRKIKISMIKMRRGTSMNTLCRTTLLLLFILIRTQILKLYYLIMVQSHYCWWMNDESWMNDDDYDEPENDQKSIFRYFREKIEKSLNTMFCSIFLTVSTFLYVFLK